MKKILLASLFLFFSAGFINAQSISILYQSDDTITGPTFVDLEAYIHFQNTSASPQSYLAEKIELSMATEHTAYFCWEFECYPVEVFVAEDTLTLAPNQADSNFIGYLQPYDTALVGYDGVSTVKYRIWNINDTSDNFEKIFIYVAGNPTALSHSKVDETDIYVYPNPASTELNLVFGEIKGKNGKLVIRNVLGSKVQSQSIILDENFAQVDLSRLSNGIYLYTLEVDGVPTVTKKFSVRK